MRNAGLHQDLAVRQPWEAAGIKGSNQPELAPHADDANIRATILGTPVTLGRHDHQEIPYISGPITDLAKHFRHVEGSHKPVGFPPSEILCPS